MTTTGDSLPGQRTLRTNTPRNVLLSTKVVRTGKGVVDATYAYDGKNTSLEDELREGTIMARITASKLWVPCKRTVVATSGGHSTTAAPEGSEEVLVDDARAFKVGDTVTVGANTGLTITAVDYDTDIITVDDDVTFADGAVVFASGDLAGAEIARGILNSFVKLKDEDGVWRDKLFSGMVQLGHVDQNMVLGDLTAILAATNYLNDITFGDESGQN